MLIIIVKEANNKFSSALPDLFYCTILSLNPKGTAFTFLNHYLQQACLRVLLTLMKGVSFCFERSKKRYGALGGQEIRILCYS